MQLITNFDNFEFRCHYLGELLTPAKAKSNLQKYNAALDMWEKKQAEYSEMKNKQTATAIKCAESIAKNKMIADELEDIKDVPIYSESCKTRLAQIYTEATTGRTKNIQSKYLEKGLHTEEDGITLYSRVERRAFKKNKIRMSNGFIQGEMDFEDGEDISVDNKSSWDAFTFDRNAVKKLDNNYIWQGHGYMWLFNKKVHRVVYTLLNTPDFLIKGQLKKIEYELPEDQWEAAKQDVMKNNIYDDLPIERKVRVFEIKRDDTKIDMIKANVPNWRYFLNNYETMNNINEDDTD